MSKSTEGRTHYFPTRERWGHSQYLEQTSEPNESGEAAFAGLTISTPVVREGDFIEWDTEYGFARVLVTSTEYVRDPDDMVEVTLARMVQRLGKGREVLWEAPAPVGSTSP